MRYLGGKSRIAKRIAPHITNTGRSHYVEPFVGGLAVLAEVVHAFDGVVAADVHGDLIDMYRAIQQGWVPPSELSEDEYTRLRGEPPSPLRTFAGFGASFGGKWWGGYARSPSRPSQNYASQTRNSLLKAKQRGCFAATVEFVHKSVFEFDVPADVDLSDFVIYCDPPYAGTTKYANTGKFDHDAFWTTAKRWSNQGALVIISEYTAPYGATLIDSFNPQSSLKAASSDRVPERLFTL